MKHLFFLSVFMILPVMALAQVEVEIDGIYYRLFPETKQATVMEEPGYDEILYARDIDEPVQDKGTPSRSYSGDMVIPETVTYEDVIYTVTSIGGFAFRECRDLTSVTIPNSVTCIETEAFLYCRGLTTITIPQSVTSIECYAFRNSGLTSVTIPDGVTSLENGVFGGCSSLTSITIPNSVTSLGEDFLAGCSSLTSVTIPNSVTSLGYACFQNSGLTSITIPNSVTSIGGHAFYKCSNLTSINIPSSVTSIGHQAFDGCSSLVSVTIPDGVTTIGIYFFNRCGSLTSVTLGSGVSSLDKRIFSNDTNLTDIYCYASKVPATNNDTFIDFNINNAVLHVPALSVDAYKAAAGWNEFKEIVALSASDPNPTGIHEMNNGTDRSEFWDLSGKQLLQPCKGLNIVRMSDGKTKKIIVK